MIIFYKKLPRAFLAALLLIACLLVYFAQTSSADYQGPNSPGTVANDNSIGTQTWSNSTYAMTSDANYATNSGGNITHRISRYLKATNFGFTIPTGATINGIFVEIERYQDYYDTMDQNIQIVKADGTIGSTNRSTGAYWNSTESYVSFGSSADLWGETWTPANINDVHFGVAFAAWLEPSEIAHVNHIRITVYYTPATPAVTGAHIGGGTHLKGVKFK